MLDIKKILQANLTELLERRPDISRLDLSKQMKVADGTLGRIKYGTGNPTVDVLDQIARFFKVEPWQLLAENLGRSGSAIENASKKIEGIDDELFESLPEHDKREIADLIKFKAERWKREPANSRHKVG